MKKIITNKKHLPGFAFLIFWLLSSAMVNAQDKLTIRFTGLPLEEAMKRIETSSKYTFFYDDKKTDIAQRVSVDAQNESIESVLSSMLKTTDLTFEIEHFQIALISKKRNETPGKTVKISGVVKDERGEPITGANIVVKNTTIGVTTDLEGRFTLDAPEKTPVEISFIGFARQEIVPTKNQVFNIILAEDATVLSDVVVIGYGSVKKTDATGAVEIIKSSDFNKGIASSPEALFNGHIAGVQVTPGSGQPGSNTSVRIRGVNSISASSEPLYVIDGVPIDNSRSSTLSLGGDAGLNTMTLNPLSMIAASDIESMTVLKDASATAIYGSRGANGVIIINTKSGKEGIMAINYSSSVGISTVSNRIDVLDAAQYRSYMPSITRTTETDWQDQIFRTAVVHDHNLTFSNGSKNTNYRASVNISSQDGVVISTGLQRYTLRFNVTHKMFDERLIFNVNANNTYYTFNNILEQQTGGADGGIINNALKADPTQPVYNADGTFNEYAKTIRNPVAMAKQVSDKSQGDRFIGSADATLFILPEILSAKVNFGYDSDNSSRKAYQPSTSIVAKETQGRAITENNRYSNYLLESYITFNKTFKQIHALNVVGGYSWQEFDNYASSVDAQRFVNDNLGADNIGGGAYQVARNNHEKNRLISFYGRVNYGLLDKYLLTATVRRDGSSRFGTNNRWAMFPSAALAWKIKEEDFMKEISFVDDLKLRLGFGVTGNQDIGNFKYSQTYEVNSLSGTFFNGTFYPSYNITGIANPNLKWEQSAQWNLGLDFSLFQNRLRGSLDFYSKKTTNLLLSIDAIQPAVSSTYLDNIGAMTNKGVELTLNASLISNDTFDWSSNFNIAYNRNRITELYNNKDIIYGIISGAGASGNSQILQVGAPIGSFYGHKFLGIEDGKEQFEPGDRTIIGHALPDYILGFTNNFSYKNWDLSVILRSNLGGETYNNTRAELSQGSRLPGQNTNVEGAEFYKAGGGGIVYSSSRWVENASFLRLDNMTLGYTFQVAPKVIKSARVYATAQNLFVLTKYKGFDPEVNNNSGDKGVKSIGIDYCSYPHARTFVLGINVNF